MNWTIAVPMVITVICAVLAILLMIATSFYNRAATEYRRGRRDESAKWERRAKRLHRIAWPFAKKSSGT